MLMCRLFILHKASLFGCVFLGIPGPVNRSREQGDYPKHGYRIIHTLRLFRELIIRRLKRFLVEISAEIGGVAIARD